MTFPYAAQWILSLVIILSSLGVIIARKPVYASLSFLLTLLTLAVVYIELSAQFIGVMQIIVYAGAILVLFMFVIVLFQDSYERILNTLALSTLPLLVTAAVSFIAILLFIGLRLLSSNQTEGELPNGFGTVQALGQALYVDFFFPFEAVILLFLVALIGALYIGRREK